MKKKLSEKIVLPSAADVTEFAKLVNVQAVMSGWWGVCGDDGTLLHGPVARDRVIAGKCLMITSEVIEALEEYRDGSKGAFQPCKLTFGSGEHASWVIVGTDGCPDIASGYESRNITHKPEGFLVELADVFIRQLDLAVQLGETHKLVESLDSLETRMNLGPLFDDSDIPWALQTILEAHYMDGYLEAFELLVGWCAENDWPLLEMAYVKHAYNKTRAFRHGGKRI